MTARPGTLPKDALLRRYSEAPNTYTDCFACSVPGQVTLEQFIAAFYLTPLFGAERQILWLVGRRSTQQDILDLAAGRTTRFAAWDVEERTEREIMLCDMAAKTRSWLRVDPTETSTRLFFGSAVTPNQEDQLGRTFDALLWFHTLYSKGLLNAAQQRLRQ